MFKYLFTACFIAIATIATAQTEFKKTWDKTDPLQWSDFQAPVDRSSKYFAQIESGSNYRFKWTQRDGKYSFTFEVTGNMTPSKSWSIPEKQTPELLKHEQGHFDISEFFARQLLAAFNAFSFTSNFDKEIDDLRVKMSGEREAMQKIYDNQTNHSLNKEMQGKWDAYLADLLSHQYKLDEALLKEPSVK